MREGKIVKFAGRDLTVPPFNLRTLRNVAPALEVINRMGTDVSAPSIDAVAQFIAAGISANYPEITADTVLDEVPAYQLRELLQAVMDASGLQARTGEAPAVDPSSGTTSTAT